MELHRSLPSLNSSKDQENSLDVILFSMDDAIQGESVK